MPRGRERLIFSLGRFDEAERLYQDAIELRSGYWENYNEKGKFCVHRGKLDEAKELFTKVIALRPVSSIGYSNLGVAYMVTGDPQAAQPVLEAAIKIEPTARTYSNLGATYYALGQFGKAVDAYASATKLEPEAGYYGNLADAYRQLGQKAGPREAYQKAVEGGELHMRFEPADMQYQAAFAMWLAAAGKCPEARRMADQSAKTVRDDPSAQYYAAVTCALCGDHTATVHYAKLAVAAGGGNDMKTNPDLVPVLTLSAEGRVLLSQNAGR